MPISNVILFTFKNMFDNMVMEVMPMTIGEKIYKFRIYLGLSQKDFADKVGTSQSAINYWENGKRQPRVTQLKKIARFIDYPLYLLMDDSYELGDIELEMKRAKFVGSTEMTEPPKPFTQPLHGRELPKQKKSKKFDYLDENFFNYICYKMARKESLTEEEEAYRLFHLSVTFRINTFARYYFTLNKEGKNKADEVIDRAIEQIALLTKIPEYLPKPPEPPQE